MQRKRSIHVPKGMSKDMSDSKLGSEYYIDALNIRLTAAEDNTLLSITNAKGNKAVTLDKTINGKYLGHAVLNNYIVLFTTPDTGGYGYIYRIDTGNSYHTVLLAHGPLNFDLNNPIETLPMYEKEDVQKVYWIDGKNQPRFINIADKIESGVVVPRTDSTSESRATEFDFVATLALNETVTVTRNETTIGTISAGAIQYALTYYNTYGQESNIFHQSSLNYISYNNRGASPEDTTVSASFTINAQNLDTNFEFVRIYAIHRTSLNGTPTVRRVVDLPIEATTSVVQKTASSTWLTGTTSSLVSGDGMLSPRPIHTFTRVSEETDFVTYDTPNSIQLVFDGITYETVGGDAGVWHLKVYTSGTNKGKIYLTCTNSGIGIHWNEGTVTSASIKFTDDGSKGETVDPTIMLFVGGKTIIPQAMGHKDNTLFFGNYQEKGSIVSETSKTKCKGTEVTFSSLNEKMFNMGSNSGYYSYKSGLTENLSKISTFKYLEYYRFGIQAQKATGEWSEPIFLKDKQNTRAISYSGSNVYLTGATATLSADAKNALKADGYVKVRPLIVYPTLTDRECICQGVLAPTVFNVEDRKTNSPWCQSSWFFRPNSPSDVTSGGGGGTDPTNVSVLCLPVRGGYWGDFTVGQSIWIDYYRVGPGYTATCELEIVGTTSNVKTSGSASSYSYGMLAVRIKTSGVTLTDLTSDSHASERNLKIRTSSATSGNERGFALYTTNGTLAIESSNILEAVLKDSGSNASMSWNNDYTYGSDTYTWNCQASLKESSESTGSFSIYASFSVTKKGGEATVTGTIPEFRHWKVIPSAKQRNAEIQCNFASTGCLKSKWSDMGSDDTERYNANFTEKVVDISVAGTDTSLDSSSYIDQFSDMFFVDQSVLTFHSPDIEFDTNTRSIDNSLLKMRIVGYIPITSTISDVDIQTSAIQLNYRNTSALPRGFWHETVGGTGVPGVGSLNAAAMWYDEEYHGDSEPDGENKKQYTTAFMTYPWHRTGSLNNQNSKDKDNYRSAMLKRKVMSNLRFSYQTKFLTYSKTDTELNYTLSGIALFDANEIVNSRITAPSGSINYYGNVDKIVSSSRVFRIDEDHQVTGYPIFKTTRFQAGSNLKSYHSAFMQKSIYEITDHSGSGDVDSTQKQQRFGSDPVQIKYKSTPHAVLSMSGTNILPTAKDKSGNTLNAISSAQPFWSNSSHTITQSVIDVNMTYGWLWLAELYNDSVTSRFGGDSDDAIKNNTWVPCGQPVTIDDAATSGKGIKWIEGDTFFQRYDCLKTYPFTNEDTNSIVDILSFMCETRVNIDGRYDRNRGQNSNLQMSPVNFNLLNYVYSQNNNFFSYRTLDKTLFNLDTYRNYITWTKKKTPGEEVDTWTNITLANVMDLDGDKGIITALKRYNNSLFAFQDKAFSQILYNENTQLSTTAGVPIEIANSGKVEGKRYVSETVGCTNKWSIIESPYGLYFMDSNNATIHLYNGKLEDLTSKFGFNSWARQNINSQVWKPAFNTFRTFYDSHKKDVYFVNKTSALNFSENLNQFTSFISYEDTPAMFNVGNKFYAFKDGVLYEQDGGDYGVFFGVVKPYHITFVDNQDYVYDKTYTNLEFRAVVDPDMANSLFSLPFDKLTASTDYQSGSVDFKPQNSSEYKSYPSLVRKFRVWRADIPRAVWTTTGGITKQDRMRNPWIHLKLEKTVPDGTTKQNKVEMHDLIVDYYV